MNIYFVLISFIYVMLVISLIKPRLRNESFVFSLIILVLFACFRGNGDGDYFNYKEYTELFVDVYSLFKFTFIEIGFRVLSLIANTFNLDPQVVLMSMNIISLGTVGYVLNKHSKNPMLSLIVFLPFYFQLDMHSARTAVAASIGLLSFSFMIEKAPLKSLVAIFCAFLFHKTALILLLPMVFSMPIINRFIYSTKSFVLIGLLLIFKSFVSLTGLLVYILDLLNFSKLQYKVESYLASKFAKPFSLFDPRLILALVIFGSIYYIFSKNIKYKKLDKVSCGETRTSNLMLIYAFVNVLLYILLSDATIFAVRFTHYFNMITCLTIPYMFNWLYETIRESGISMKKRTAFGIFCVLSVTLYFGYTLIVLPKVPYTIYTFGISN